MNEPETIIIPDRPTDQKLGEGDRIYATSRRRRLIKNPHQELPVAAFQSNI